jgi:hypothetical protein
MRCFAGSAKPRKPPSKREPWEGTDDDEEEAEDHRKGARAAAAARRGRAAAKSRTAGRGGGGGIVGGSTSSYRGVGQHCHTLRWESHLWDGDMARSATPGTPRTKGKQVGRRLCYDASGGGFGAVRCVPCQHSAVLNTVTVTVTVTVTS